MSKLSTMQLETSVYHWRINGKGREDSVRVITSVRYSLMVSSYRSGPFPAFAKARLSEGFRFPLGLEGLLFDVRLLGSDKIKPTKERQRIRKIILPAITRVFVITIISFPCSFYHKLLLSRLSNWIFSFFQGSLNCCIVGTPFDISTPID